jgi:ABC-type multidrug transport system ATPase subunit
VSTPEIISIRNLSKSYGALKAVDDLSIGIERGEFFGFLGPNGAGKTTTIRMLTSMIRPDSGQIAIGGLAPDRRAALSRMIGVVPESRGFYDWMTGREYLDFFAIAYGVARSERAALVRSLLGEVKLSASADARIGTFSRGMRQRLGLARALVNSPLILFLDEPTLGLDPQGQEDIRELLRRLNSDGVTVFLSSHLLHEVADLCSRIAILSRGRLVAEGSLDELRRRSGLTPAYYIRVSGDAGLVGQTAFSAQITALEADVGTSAFLFHGDGESANRLLDLLREHGLEVLEFRSEGEDLSRIFLTLTSQ